MSGMIPLSMSQNVDINGQPLAGALLYIFQVGTVATPQNSYQDFGLTLVNPNPLQADQNGRFPAFYLADGQVHVRLTDSTGVVVFDYPDLQVLGPSSGGGGGGGGSVDPTSIAATGDMKFRPTAETLTGWVKANGQTIGSASSGATQRANADTQNLFVYLWSNFSNAKCAVSGGRGASALADFQANKTIQLLDWRSRSPCGLDDMGASAAGRLLAANVTSGAGDGPTTPGATGGEANHTLLLAEAPTGQITMSAEVPHSHSIAHAATASAYGSGSLPAVGTVAGTTGTATTGLTLTDNAGGGAHNNMNPFMLGTWHQKL